MQWHAMAHHLDGICLAVDVKITSLTCCAGAAAVAPHPPLSNTHSFGCGACMRRSPRVWPTSSPSLHPSWQQRAAGGRGASHASPTRSSSERSSPAIVACGGNSVVTPSYVESARVQLQVACTRYCVAVTCVLSRVKF